ncbi:MAG: GNAT family N-acetyltransferase [Candidatus Obscuribacterales bacterium]|nr:GNAT family N-acetyltransferase [Candidatus Obscuribacterales bacterium]
MGLMIGEVSVSVSAPGIVLRDVVAADLDVFFQHRTDPIANHMAAFTAKDPFDKDAFVTHWERLLANELIIKKSVLLNDVLIGNVLKFERFALPEVSYWIAREHWGKGIATIALTQLISGIKLRPLYARAATDNVASFRVLQKCGFEIYGYETVYANARGTEIEEVILRLGSGSSMNNP